MRRLVLLAVLAMALALPSVAAAGIVTIGPTETVPGGQTSPGSPATLINTAAPPEGNTLVSPVTGVILRWRATGFVGGPFRLRVLTPLGEDTYLGAGSSAPVVSTSPATQTFPANLWILAGQTIAVDLANAGDEVGYLGVTGAAFGYIAPPLADGASAKATVSPAAQYLFNADVLPPPTIASITPTSGILASGSTVRVTITGTNFSEVTGVAFGGVPTTYTVESDSRISAIPAPQVQRGPRLITVTTRAGIATSSQTYRYTACVVPKLKGKKLKRAKRLIRESECRVGFVKKRGEATAKTGRVVVQTPPAGRVVRTGSKVRVTLAE